MKKRTIFLLILAVVLACVLFFCRFYFLGTSSDPVNAKTNADFQIPDFHSQTDKDEDGLDDQTDLLQGARTYIATQPRYKSKYYETGYPDDGYGVCTDVIANAMLSAGYDLKELVAEDIAAHPEEYDIEEPDPNIDFPPCPQLERILFPHRHPSDNGHFPNRPMAGRRYCHIFQPHRHGVRPAQRQGDSLCHPP